MTEENPGILSHVSLGTNNLDAALEFYDKVLAELGIRRLEFMEGIGAAYGKVYPEFWIQNPHDGKAASDGNGNHIAFVANSRKEVQQFHKAALAAGATDDGAPDTRPHYGEPYYGCFLRDLDGHKLEATFWDMSLMK